MNKPADGGFGSVVFRVEDEAQRLALKKKFDEAAAMRHGAADLSRRAYEGEQSAWKALEEIAARSFRTGPRRIYHYEILKGEVRDDGPLSIYSGVVSDDSDDTPQPPA